MKRESERFSLVVIYKVIDLSAQELDELANRAVRLRRELARDYLAPDQPYPFEMQIVIDGPGQFKPTLFTVKEDDTVSTGGGGEETP